MRIRDRLIALAAASLNPSRSARGSATAPHGASSPTMADELAALEGEESAAGAPAPGPELPRQLGEQMLQSIHASLQRLAQTAEALAVLASAIATAETAVRQHLAAAAGHPPAAQIHAAPLLGGPPPSGRASSPTSPPVNLAGGVMTLALHAANARALDGSYLFTGSGGDPPFSADGSYRGTSSGTVVVMLPGPPPHLAVAAASLTCLGPLPTAMDVLPRLARAQAACGAGTTSGLEACRGPLAEAAAMLVHLQARVDAAQAVLADATSVTAELVPPRVVLEAEPEHRSAQLAQTFGALEAARSLAERTLAIFPSQG
jgi:hypothetical protein